MKISFASGSGCLTDSATPSNQDEETTVNISTKHRKPHMPSGNHPHLPPPPPQQSLPSTSSS